MQIMNLGNFFKDFIYGCNLRRVMKNLPDAVFIVQTDGRISWVNDKATTVFEGGKRLLKSYHFDDLVDNGIEKVDKSIATRTPVIAGAFTPTAREFFIELNAKKYHGSFIVTIRDITAMTNILTSAEQTSEFNKEKNAMLVKLSNEIKSPINSIVGFSQALIDGIGGEINEKQDKYVKIINKNSNDLLYFMEKFIEFAYAESTLYECDLQTFDIVNTIQNVIRSNDLAISAKNLTVNLDVEEIVKRAVYSDEKSLKTILQNLLEISIKLTDTGSISLKATYPNEELVRKLRVFENVKPEALIQISISDTGIGLQEAEMDGLFEPYSQLDRQNKKNIVRSISLGTTNILAKRLQGIVWAESEVMKGTTFNLIIPIERDFHLKHE
ncbi:MAG: PAS domain-containing protein [Cyanobacteria bacterium SIG32]|nr:PAS domain-containing protein [Cyanobacteria bacterium SIG32]